MTRLALFDLDGTLTGSPDGPFRRAMAEFAAERGLGPEDRQWLIVDAIPHWSATPQHYFRAVIEHFGLDDDPDDLYQAYRARSLALIRPMSGVVAGLTALREAGWRTAVVTNGSTGPQLAKIEALRLPDLVDAWCVSEAEGCQKPDPAIFRRAARKAGASLDGGWMTGDSLAADIAGGNALGLTTAWISAKAPPADGPVPTHVIGTVAEVFALILADG